MTVLATASATSSAPASAFFARWIDHSTWASWSPDTEWVTLDAPVALGTTGALKPSGGPTIRFTISALETNREYTDTSRLPGARLVFQHLVTETPQGTRLDVRVEITGPLSGLWARIMGGGFAESAPADLDRLIAIVEHETADTAARG
jgi:hypothetical protein